MKYHPIPVSVAEELAATHNKETVVILAYDRQSRRIDVTAFGGCAVSKETARRYGEKCAAAIGGDLSTVDVHEDFHADFNPAVQKEALDILRSIGGNKRYAAALRQRIERLLLLADALRGEKVSS